MSRKGALLFGVAINDADYPVRVKDKETGRIFRCPFHAKWSGMISRCFSENYQDKKPSYKECTVCDEWLYFSKFKAWMEQQDWQGKHLDKDILKQGNKHYSPEFCCFVDQLTNSFVVDSTGSRGAYPLGVYFHKRRKKFHARCSNQFTKNTNEHVGYFDTAELAHEAWRKRKLELANRVALLQADERVAEALIRRYS